ncbi:hypothetical protein [Metabacillus fastidiosus]|uniref:Uncharacterized protein n=1 Tax=Metabacillus fastidiosus TaxID=1458 RepID=A0ABU6NZZ8_9BACI|nr:hypothetical protein [Metabacillus fastidiosus]MEC2076682.1 hypothetical protein [Metabacillus fastidiosus]MED4402675.1 hypothetical protein [Metabacillus fastidiosus]MED4454850.1 hypothetical protein [Metabacillus fastidiosus]MED4462034.1 hypothetical protein [Metabacillus fastidiosus]
MMFWLRLIPVVFFSFSAISLFMYQGIEIFNAVTDYFNNKK